MKTASIEEAKERLEELIAAAQAGEPVVITDGGETVASLTALRDVSPEPELAREQTVRRLELAGLLRPNPRMPDAELLAEFGLSEDAVGLLQALLDEREEAW